MERIEQVLTRHPSRYSRQLLPVLRKALDGAPLPWLDPMAGIGGSEIEGVIHNELEPEWALQCCPPSLVGDTKQLPFPDNSIGAILTSPTYGNRMADCHVNKEKCRSCSGVGISSCPKCEGKGQRVYKRNTYTHSIGRSLSAGNTGRMQWGSEYRRVHELIYTEFYRVLKPNGVLVVNVKNHIRKHRVQNVVEWTSDMIWACGFSAHNTTSVKCPGNRYGANSSVRVDEEWVLEFRRDKIW